MEKKILKLLLNKEYYTKIRPIINENELGILSKDVLKVIDNYYETDQECQHVDPDVLTKELELSLGPKHKDMGANIVNGILEEDISEINLARLLVKLKRLRIGADLSIKLLDGSAEEQINKLISDYVEVGESITDIVEDKNLYHNVSIHSVLEKIEIKNRIPLYPKSLNERIKGGAIRGQNILIFARPEMGKTLFAINLIGGFLHKGLRVLYVGNEDPCSAIIPRVISRLVEAPIEEIQTDPSSFQERLEKRNYNNLYLEDVTPGTWPFIRKRIKEIQPDVLVIDQIRHIQCGNLSKVEQMERVAIEARNAAKTYNILSIGITQAGDSAEDKPVLGMSDVDFSNTGMQGAVDLMIGIGANEEMINQGRRMISLPKNKIGGVHDFFPVQYIIPINKVESL